MMEANDRWRVSMFCPLRTVWHSFRRERPFHARIRTISERQAPTAVVQRIVIRFLIKENVKNTYFLSASVFAVYHPRTP